MGEHGTSLSSSGRSIGWLSRARNVAVTACAVVGTLGFGGGVSSVVLSASSGHASRYIVEGLGRLNPESVVWQQAGRVREKLPLVHGVVAELTPSEARAIAAQPGVSITPDSAMQVQGLTNSVSSSTSSAGSTGASGSTTRAPASVYPQITGATKLWALGDKGQGTSVAVIDTGINASLPDLAGRVIGGVDLSGNGNPFQDTYGHGTFVAGLIASDGVSSNGQYMGEAPDTDLVSVRVAGADGSTSMATVIQGIEWVIQNKSTYNIGVINLSLGVMPTGPTSTEPLDQAVEAAWNAGIVVVVSAGNSGPSNGTITSPGDDPLVITAGALDDDGGTNPANFAIPSFSSVGPTLYDGWFKPDLVASGRSVVSLADPGSTIYDQNPQAIIGSANFVGSGTSFSAAVTSGMVAELLTAHPNLSPGMVKGRLLLTATTGPVGNPFVDGHGVGNVWLAALAQAVNLNQSVAALAEQATPNNPVSLYATWLVSSFNGANWVGSTWNGSTWNGSTWNGSSWNGSSWNGSQWNGSTWNGAAWNGATWNGATWNGSSWNGSSWNGSSWNGSSWNGSQWNGSQWNGSQWNGDSWS